MGTLILLIFFILASIGVYLLHEHVIQQEITVTSVFGRVEPPSANLAVGVSYLLSSKAPLVYKQGDTFYALLYLRGNSTVSGISVNTQGFSATSITPDLPLKVDNFSVPQIMVVGITILKCCYQGNVSITLNGSA